MSTIIVTKTISATNLQSDLNYIGIIEENNMRMIAGLSTYINYEGIEVTRVMHVIIYNTTTKEVIYSTGNNLRMELDTLLQHAEGLLLILDKHITDRFYLNKFMNMYFYDCKFETISRMARQIRNDIQEQEYNTRRQQTAVEREQLEKELYTTCKDKQILILKNSCIGFILVHDKQMSIKQDSKSFKETIYNIIKANTISNYKELECVKIESLEYDDGNMLESNIKAIELLKRHIEYIRA
jgi:hypothetical protein